MSTRLPTLSFLASAWLALWVPGARGQPMVSVVSPEVPIPANGAVVIQALGTDPVVQVRAEGSDTTLAGTLRPVVTVGSDGTERYLAWVPSSPLEPGRYEVTMFALQTQLAMQTITAVDAIDLSVVPAPAEPHLEWREAPHEASTCVTWNGTQVVPDWRSSFPSTKRGYLEMTSDIDSSFAPELTQQFLYSSTPTGSPASNVAPYNPGSWAWTTAWSFNIQSERYCVTYRAMSVVTGEEHMTERCAEHGDLPSLDLEALEVPDEKLERAVCPGPPAGFEERWCMINRACDALSDPDAIEADHCYLYGAACRNECLPGGIALSSIVLPGGGGGGGVPTPWGGAGTSGGAVNMAPCVEVEMAPDEDVEPDAAAPSADDDADDGAEEHTGPDTGVTASDSGGCGCSAIGAAQSERGAAAALVVLLFYRRRSVSAAVRRAGLAGAGRCSAPRRRL